MNANAIKTNDMTSNVFDFNRFCRVVYRDLQRLWRTMGTTMLVLSLMPFALWLMAAVWGFTMPAEVRWAVVVILVLLASIMAPSRLYRTINLRGEGIHFAMLPASKLEKWLSILLYTLLVCPLLTLVAATALDSLLALLPGHAFEGYVWQVDLFGLLFSELADVGFSRPLFSLTALASYVENGLLFLMTATIFKKHKVLQTFLWLYALNFVLSLVSIPLMSLVDFISLSDGLTAWAESHSEEQLLSTFNWLMAGGCIADLLFAALFGWIGWRRIDRMAY